MGVINTSLGVLCIIVLLRAESPAFWHFWLATFLLYNLNYTLNAWFTFKLTPWHVRRYLSFMAVLLAANVIATLFRFIFVDYLDHWLIILFQLCIVLPIMYLASRFWVFRAAAS